MIAGWSNSPRREQRGHKKHERDILCFFVVLFVIFAVNLHPRLERIQEI
jgi:hypothetical protein